MQLMLHLVYICDNIIIIIVKQYNNYMSVQLISYLIHIYENTYINITIIPIIM